MYRKIVFILVVSISLFGCYADINNPKNNNSNSNYPVPPQGLIAIAQSNQVYLSWYYNYESWVSSYNIYVSTSYRGRYSKIGTTSKNEFYDKGASNGTTYYYAITAISSDGYESELSTSEVFATPRPEIFNVVIYDYRSTPDKAGFIFGSNAIVAYNNSNADIYFENSSGVYYFNVYNDTQIQDMGYTSYFDEISKSPTTGWSPTKDVRVILGHTYVIYTFDKHYAKIRVTSVQSDRVEFACAFQLQQNNPYLKRLSKPLK